MHENHSLINDEVLSENLENFKESYLQIECCNLIVNTLEEEGVRIAFGIPGGALSNIFNSLSKSSLIDTVLTQHETGAAYMAMGRTLVGLPKKELGLCFATSGPGITNLITGVAAAYEEKIPIFVLTGNVSTALINRGAAQDAHASGINAVRMLDPITCRSLTVTQSENIEELIRELYAEALHTRLPVHLNIPVDVATSFIPTSKISSHKNNFFNKFTYNYTSKHLVIQSINSFFQSERPLLFVGNGIKTSNNTKLLKDVIERLQLPLILTSHAKGAIADEHPLYFGNFGFAANDRATEFLKTYDPDAILFLGTRLTEPSSAGWSPLLSKPKLKIHVDQNIKELNRIYQVDHPICEDMGTYLTEMLNLGSLLSDNTHSLSRISTQLKSVSKTDQEIKLDGPINPQTLMQLIDLWLPDNSLIFSDIGNSMAWILNSLPIRDGQELYVPIGLGSMGSGLCGAIGAKSVLTHRPVVCFTGDCTMLMHGTELFTALNAGIGIKIFVLNDGGHGMVDHGHRILGLTDINVRFNKSIDFKTFSKALHVPAFSVKTLKELSSLPFDQIFSSNEPALIEIKIDHSIVPPILARARVLGQNNKRQVS